ncbi:hypothetical protein [Stenotrophomonas maltophilia]|uniref:phosphatase domain-containing protein n=1 Tax=Stenotrophomonas maltophilia TaxID=40324 RepID=UPI003CCF989E
MNCCSEAAQLCIVRGGLGRAGTVACLLLLETGTAATGEQAMSMVRQVRTGAIETREQEDFIRAWSPGPGSQTAGN